MNCARCLLAATKAGVDEIAGVPQSAHRSGTEPLDLRVFLPKQKDIEDR